LAGLFQLFPVCFKVWKQAGLHLRYTDYETILFVCRRARQALNDTVEKLEKELKEAQLKEAHSKKQVL
jgi:hypothetical protein